MEKPTPDGRLVVETMRPGYNEQATRVFKFADIRSWRKDDIGLTICKNPNHKGLKMNIFFPWHNVAEFTVILNSDEYQKAYREWEKQHDSNEPPRGITLPPLLV